MSDVSAGPVVEIDQEQKVLKLNGERFPFPIVDWKVSAGTDDLSYLTLTFVADSRSVTLGKRSSPEPSVDLGQVIVQGIDRMVDIATGKVESRSFG